MLNIEFYNVKTGSQAYMVFAFMILNCLEITAHSITTFEYSKKSYNTEILS
jgi:hypothetical protein